MTDCRMVHAIRAGRAGSKLRDHWAVALLSAFVVAAFSTRARGFVGNQHTYLAHAQRLVDGAVFEHDWFTRTIDPTPLFTRLASLLLKAPGVLWLTNALLGAVFFTSLAAIARACRGPARGVAGSLSYLAALFALAWSTLPSWLHQPLFEGVAQQRAYTAYLQPSNAGVLLIVSCALFIGERPALAVLLAGVSSWLHPTYVVPGATLVGAALMAGPERGSWRRVGGLCALFVLVVLPPSMYTAASFAPASAGTLKQAAEVLTLQRFPHHADPRVWLSWTNAAQLAIVVAAWASAPLFARRLLLIGSALTLLLCAAWLLLNRPELLLLFPWRSSVWLCPLAFAALFGAGLRAFSSIAKPEHSDRLLYIAGAIATVVLVLRNGQKIEPGDWAGVSLARHIPVHERRHWQLLIPPDWQGVRLNAPAAVYIDFKSHPYKDTEVLTWYQKLSKARAVYGKPEDQACAGLRALLNAEPRIGFVLSDPRTRLDRCQELAPSVGDREGRLYRVRGRTSP